MEKGDNKNINTCHETIYIYSLEGQQRRPHISTTEINDRQE